MRAYNNLKIFFGKNVLFCCWYTTEFNNIANYTQSIYNYQISNRAVKTQRVELIHNHIFNFKLFKEIKKT